LAAGLVRAGVKRQSSNSESPPCSNCAPAANAATNRFRRTLPTRASARSSAPSARAAPTPRCAAFAPTAAESCCPGRAGRRPNWRRIRPPPTGFTNRRVAPVGTEWLKFPEDSRKKSPESIADNDHSTLEIPCSGLRIGRGGTRIRPGNVQPPQQPSRSASAIRLAACRSLPGCGETSLRFAAPNSSGRSM